MIYLRLVEAVILATAWTIQALLLVPIEYLLARYLYLEAN